MDTRTEEEKNRHFTPEELEEAKNHIIKEKGRLSVSLDTVQRALRRKRKKARTNWQRSATMPVFYKSKARAKNKLQKMSRKANR